VHTARQNSANTNTNNELSSCYKINQGCNSRLIQIKDAREIQVTVSQFQQFRRKASSSAFISRESTFIIGCEKTSRQVSIKSHSTAYSSVLSCILMSEEAYCLPILTYAFPGLRVNASQISELNVCWNSVYRKIFHYNRWESVKCCINGLGRMDLVHILAFQA